MILFLHRNGYNFFNINKLTINEINTLVMAWNDEQDEKKRQSLKQKSRTGNKVTRRLM